MNATSYTFLGLTAIVAGLIGVLAFAVLRFFAAARDARRLGVGRSESVLLSTALEDAITKLKAQERAMAARADASDRLRSQIVASLMSGLIVVDSAGEVQILNPAARRILRISDALDAPVDALSNDLEALKSVIDESLRTGAPIVRRTVIVKRADGPMHLGVTVSPLAVDSGTGGAICLFSDLTSVIAMEEQLRLKEALARLGELTAGLAHEFRNGLATIHGYGRLLDPALLPLQQRPYVEGIRSETLSLGDIVTKFLQFARSEPLMLARADLKTVIARAAEDVPAADVALTGDFGEIDADDILLRQAFSNLFRNSAEACATAAIPARIVVHGSLDAAAGRVRVDIHDNGPGIPPAALGHLFQPFFTTRPGGTGLGLAIVQKVIVSHNGTIAAGDHPSGGALFRIMFPVGPATDSLSKS